MVLLRLRPGPAGAALVNDLAQNPRANLYLPEKPSDLADLERVGGLPSVVAGLLGVLAVATLAHTLATSARRRSRDLTILKVLGFERGQVSATVAWQSTTVAVVAVAVGVPPGAAAGRWAWQVFAEGLGVPPQTVTPVMALVLLVAGAVLLANLVAALPTRLAARTRPSAVLRSE
ncbi:MAG: FtsX-like permease family protein [Actinomycetota bacterium]|nr:FtsX-like permease family protein [Actinomycetota bacterium]